MRFEVFDRDVASPAPAPPGPMVQVSTRGWLLLNDPAWNFLSQDAPRRPRVTLLFDAELRQAAIAPESADVRPGARWDVHRMRGREWKWGVDARPFVKHYRITDGDYAARLQRGPGPRMVTFDVGRRSSTGTGGAGPVSPPDAGAALGPMLGGYVATQVLAHINAARAAAGLHPYVLSVELSKAAAAHNALMVSNGGLSHQFRGELDLRQRITAAGVSARSFAENVGQDNAADSPSSIVAAANRLTDRMLAEVPPNDGHRRHLLNAGYTQAGLAVARDGDGRVWITQDFTN